MRIESIRRANTILYEQVCPPTPQAEQIKQAMARLDNARTRTHSHSHSHSHSHPQHPSPTPQTDKMKNLRSQQMYSDVLADRDEQIGEKRVSECAHVVCICVCARG